MEFLRCKGVYQRVTRALEMRRYRKLYSLSSLRCEELPRPNKIADCSYLSATCPVGGLEATSLGRWVLPHNLDQVKPRT